MVENKRHSDTSDSIKTLHPVTKSLFPKPYILASDSALQHYKSVQLVSLHQLQEKKGESRKMFLSSAFRPILPNDIETPIPVSQHKEDLGELTSLLSPNLQATNLITPKPLHPLPQSTIPSHLEESKRIREANFPTLAVQFVWECLSRSGGVPICYV